MLAALSFLTVLGRARPPQARALDWFPVVGAAIGLALGGVWWLAGRAWAPGVAAAVVVTADLAITGLLHFDGLVDSADGLLPPVDRERRLRIMASPETGAFGTGVAGAVLLLRWAALTALRPGVVLLGGLWCLSRSLMATVARTRRYARPEGGIVSGFHGAGRPYLPLAGLAGSSAMCAAWRVVPGFSAAAGGLVAGVLVAVLAERRLGGYTGDVLGATAVVAETAGLVVAAARW